MSKLKIVQDLEAEQLKDGLPHFRVGDTLRVSFRIIEGDKERQQVFMGTVIAHKGRGLSETVTLYRVAFGGAIERVFLLHSPRVAKIERIKIGHVRRSKLYYLLGKKGKKAKVRQKMGLKGRLHPTASGETAASEMVAAETSEG